MAAAASPGVPRPLPGKKGRCFVVSLANELSCRMPVGNGNNPGTGPYTGMPLPPRLVQ